MSGERPVDTIAVMKDIDRRYREKSGLNDRCFYSIFYSRIDPAPLLVLGINPGGNPSKWTSDKLASQSFYENFEHEYVDCRYAIQEPMLPFLIDVTGVDIDGVQHIPKSNLVFRRSNGMDELHKFHGMEFPDARREAHEFVQEIIQYVSPRAILLEGISNLEPFTRGFCIGNGQPLAEEIRTDFKGSLVRCFVARAMQVKCLGRTLSVVAVGHPSAFGEKPEWPIVQSETKKVIAAVI